ncbi:hypothetical protein F4778DRAFT_703576 [Xylariomycetidae sp. FL2044]|nr:hypothetical protein F4778DRAFT_703576 [Xylariomycetidae sp. FL2044]
MSDMSRNNSVNSLAGFSVHQPAVGAALQFFPAMGTQQLDELINAYVPGDVSILDKRAAVSVEFFEHVLVTGELFKFFMVNPVANNLLAGESPASSLMDSGYGSSFTSPVVSENQWSQSTNAKKSRTSSKKTSSGKDFSHLPGMKIMTKDGLDVTNSASRGCKTKEQRDHAHLMRIIKACDSCRRKKIRCDPSHKRQAVKAVSAEAKVTKKTQRASKAQAPPIISAEQSILTSFNSSPDSIIPESDAAMLDWDQFIQYDEEPTNNTIPYGYDSFLDTTNYYSPAASSSTNSFSPTQPIAFTQPAAFETPLTDTGSAPALPYLNPGGEFGNNYVDFNLYSPGSSVCLDESDSGMTKEVAARPQHDYSGYDDGQYAGYDSVDFSLAADARFDQQYFDRSDSRPVEANERHKQEPHTAASSTAQSDPYERSNFRPVLANACHELVSDAEPCDAAQSGSFDRSNYRPVLVNGRHRLGSGTESREAAFAQSSERSNFRPVLAESPERPVSRTTSSEDAHVGIGALHAGTNALQTAINAPQTAIHTTQSALRASAAGMNLQVHTNPSSQVERRRAEQDSRPVSRSGRTTTGLNSEQVGSNHAWMSVVSQRPPPPPAQRPLEQSSPEHSSLSYARAASALFRTSEIGITVSSTRVEGQHLRTSSDKFSTSSKIIGGGRMQPASAAVSSSSSSPTDSVPMATITARRNKCDAQETSKEKSSTSAPTGIVSSSSGPLDMSRRPDANHWTVSAGSIRRDESLEQGVPAMARDSMVPVPCSSLLVTSSKKGLLSTTASRETISGHDHQTKRTGSYSGIMSAAIILASCILAAAVAAATALFIVCHGGGQELIGAFATVLAFGAANARSPPRQLNTQCVDTLDLSTPSHISSVLNSIKSGYARIRCGVAKPDAWSWRSVSGSRNRLLRTLVC